MIAKTIFAVLPLVGYASAHGCMWHKSMYGFNVTDTNSPQYGGRDNRPQAPLHKASFKEWWFHDHIDQPPHPNDIFELPAGGKATTELACDKDATSWWPSGPGGDHQNGNDPCPGPPSKLIHANGINDLGGCALAIAYKSDVNDVKPEDLVVFSVNHACVYYRYTDFEVPAKMPACPNGKCICAWLWNHQPDAGGDEMYMNGFQCNITGATSTTPIPKGKVPAKCGSDKSKCVKGPKVPMYWDQNEGNNIENYDIYDPPMYLSSWGFEDGAQNDLWDGVADAGSEAKSSSAAPTPSTVSTSTTTSVAVATSSSAAAQAAAPKPSSTSVSTSILATTTPTPAPQQVKGASPTTSSPVTTTKGGQGHRTCRAKKHKKDHKNRRSHRAF